jgi:hypothetical protein
MLQARPGRALGDFKRSMLEFRKASMSYRHGQLRHPQNAQDQSLARPPAVLSCPLHADFRVMDQSGRALAC